MPVLPDVELLTDEELDRTFRGVVPCSHRKCRKEATWRLTLHCRLCGWRRHAFQCDRHKRIFQFVFKWIVEPLSDYLKKCDDGYAHRDYVDTWHHL